MPTPEFQRRVLEKRPMPSSDPERALRNRLVKDRLYAQRIAALARERGFPTIGVDGARPLDDEVEHALAPLPPSGGDLAAARRWENEAVAANLRVWFASTEVVAALPTFSFACECGRVGCGERVELPVEALEPGSRVLAPRHQPG